MKLWWEQWPGRLEHELRALEASGISYKRDEEAWVLGVLKLRVKTTVEGIHLDLDVVFPELYPYFRFEVFAPNLDLSHHQHPFAKNLCLIGRTTENWSPWNTAAEFIENRVPLVLNAASSNDLQEIGDLEEHQGEPFSDYYEYQKDTIVLIDSSWSLDPSIVYGDLIVGVERVDHLLRGAVLEVNGNEGLLARADPMIAAGYRERLRGRWVRCEEPIREVDPVRFIKLLESQYPWLRESIRQRNNIPNIDVIGVIFPEEVRWRENADGWVFVVRPRGSKRKSKHRGKANPRPYLVRAARVGRADISARVPELVPLSNRRVALVGLGGVGAPSAIELARAGIGELRLLDHDIVEAGPIVRWPLGVPYVGTAKAETLASFIRANYPYCRVQGWVHRLGGVGSNKSDLKVLEEVLDGVDLIYDATAELGVQHLLSDLAADRGIPYVSISTTTGGWGGLLTRVRHSVHGAGCWLCLQHALMDELIPTPPADPAGRLQPMGCADPTFTGAGFDLAQVAMGGVRLAVGTLCSGLDGGYPDVDWDVAVISLRDEMGKVIVPRWETFVLNRHQSCEKCHGKH